MAQVQLPLDGVENRPQPPRSLSTSSDSTTRLITSLVPYANPAPAYIAQKPASDLIKSEINHNVIVSEPALTLVNEFLDQVLYNIISSCRSTSLQALRATIPNVLKPRLGKAALKVAEEELKEYLNDDEEVELGTKNGTIEPKSDFNPDLVWRLVRLRCMVYTRLGDLEEEDEQEWLEKEQLLDQMQAAKRNTPQAEIEMGPASAIFLTSVIEYLGEQALYYAAQYAYKKHLKSNNSDGQHAGSFGDIIVDGRDMSHVGRDSPLSRLWRSWRRNTRDSSRPMSPETAITPVTSSVAHSRSSSSAVPVRLAADPRPPADIPLPISSRDVDEIEVPGLAPTISDEEEEVAEEPQQQRRRPSSFTLIPDFTTVELLPNQVPEVPTRSPLRPTWGHTRSNSTPVPTLGKLQSPRAAMSKRDEVLARFYDQLTSPAATGSNNRDGAMPAPLQIPRDSQRSLKTTALNPPGGFVFATTGHDSLLSHGGADSAPIAPKKTVAEEILGLEPSVSPPADAHTGASITNMSDFDSMHVPVATPSGSPQVQSPPGYFQQTQASTQEQTSDATTVPSRDVQAKTAPGLSLPQAPTLRKSSSNYSLEDGGQRTPTLTGHDFAVLPPQASNAPGRESPVSAMTPSHSRPQSSASGLPSITTMAAPTEALPPAIQGRPVMADARESRNSTSSRASSRSSRLLGVAKDGFNRGPAGSQQRKTDEPKSTLSPSDSTTYIKSIRHSTSNSSANKRLTGKQYPLGGENDEAKKKSLEILIRSNETLHYTLTPAAAMRDDPAVTNRNRAQPHDRADSLSESYSPPSDAASSRTRPGGLSSNPTNPPLSPTIATGSAQRNTTPSSPQSAGPTLSPLKPKRAIGEPRDARGERQTSTRDLADYARSTGPQDENQLPRSIGARPHVVTNEASARTKSSTSVQAASPTNDRAGNKSKYQARDARPSRGAETSDLVEFLRDGPPTTVREHRIDRKVAPFRTTMDSEDFSTLANQQNSSLKEKDSDNSTRDGRGVSSVIPSVNSQTPLVTPAGRTANGANVSAPDRPAYDDDNGMPKRTRRRIKDPYAIYDSDDDDFEEDLGGKQPRPQEESLLDFLRNTGPSSSHIAQPALSDRASQRSPVARSSSAAREESPHLTQSGSKMDKYRPTHPTHASHVKRNHSKPRYEARDAKATRTNTAELAEYLKNSGPPPNSQYKPQPFILSSTPNATNTSRPQSKPVTKEDNGLFKMFSKRKK